MNKRYDYITSKTCSALAAIADTKATFLVRVSLCFRSSRGTHTDGTRRLITLNPTITTATVAILSLLLTIPVTMIGTSNGTIVLVLVRVLTTSTRVGNDQNGK